MLLPFIVTLSIKLDNQLGFGAIEVDDIRFDRMLAAELQACELTAAKDGPEK
jgi:hypothetical protein